MRNLMTIIIVILLTCLTSCVMQTYYQPKVNQDLFQEHWVKNTQINPKIWTQQADAWFFSGEPGQITDYGTTAPIRDAMTVISVRASNFQNVIIDGNFQVQLVGGVEKNSIAIIGPNVSARESSVSVSDSTVLVHQIPNPKTKCDKVIVRIGVNNLRTLMQNGNGIIMGRHILSSHLTIKAKGGGLILLEGNMNLARVYACDTSIVTIFGAYTPSLHLKTAGRGSINVVGRVGIQNIVSMGSGCINIIGADSDGLCIRALSGTVAISGRINLKKVIANGKSRVYVNCTLSPLLRVKAWDDARIGIIGSVGTLWVDLSDNARFFGRDLVTKIGYIRTRGDSHANITAQRRVFASSQDTSSIYYIGSPNTVSRFVSGSGTIIPVWTNNIANPPYYHPQNVRMQFK